MPKIGYKQTEEHKRKISIVRKGKISNFLGKHHSKISKWKNRTAHLGKHHSDETKKRMSEVKFGKHFSEEHKRRISKAHIGMYFTKKHRRNMSIAKLGKHHSEETKKKISITSKRRWQDSEYKEKTLKATFKGLKLRPTNPEKQLNRLLQKWFPNQYRYVGDSYTFIGGKCPDFINVNGQKKIIELFGDYWHSKQVTGLKKKIHRKQRQAIFAKYGYKTCVVWQRELKDIPKLKEKLLNFEREKHE